MKLADYHVKCINVPAALDEQLVAALARTTDPELGVDMLNLGLVYSLELRADNSWHIEMLLTTIGCPLTDYLEMIMKHAMALVAPDAPVTVQFRMEPAWTPKLMSRAARLTLGVPADM